MTVDHCAGSNAKKVHLVDNLLLSNSVAAHGGSVLRHTSHSSPQSCCQSGCQRWHDTYHRVTQQLLKQGRDDLELLDTAYVTGRALTALLLNSLTAVILLLICHSHSSQLPCWMGSVEYFQHLASKRGAPSSGTVNAL